MDNLYFFQIGCGRTANYAALTKPDWHEHFYFPCIDRQSKWKGVLVDLHPASIIDIASDFADESNLQVLHAAVAGTPQFAMVESRAVTDIDQEARLCSAEKYNDKFRPDFKGMFYCHTITLDQLFGFIEKESEIGLLALDVQGSEVEILRGYGWHIRPLFIDIETHSADALSITSAILIDQGYSYVHRRPDGRRRVNHLWKGSRQ